MDKARNGVPQSFPLKPEIKLKPNNLEELVNIGPHAAAPSHLNARIEISVDDLKRIVLQALASDPAAIRAILGPHVRAIIQEIHEEQWVGLTLEGLPDIPPSSAAEEPPMSAVEAPPAPEPESVSQPEPSPVKPVKKRRMDAHRGTEAYRLRKAAEQRRYTTRKKAGLVIPKAETQNVPGAPPATAPKTEESVEAGGKEDG